MTQAADADAAIDQKHAQCPHISKETHAYYWGRNAAWAAIAEGQKKISNPFQDKSLRAGFSRGVRTAMAEERLDLDTEWD
jgi:predicted transcriptional regulator